MPGLGMRAIGCGAMGLKIYLFPSKTSCSV